MGWVRQGGLRTKTSTETFAGTGCVPSAWNLAPPERLVRAEFRICNAPVLETRPLEQNYFFLCKEFVADETTCLETQIDVNPSYRAARARASGRHDSARDVFASHRAVRGGFAATSSRLRRPRCGPRGLVSGDRGWTLAGDSELS